MKKIVITGATSFIGVHLVKEWLKHECIVYAIIRPNSKNSERLPQDNRVVKVELDMEQYGSLSDVIPTADVFYHLAWEGARLPYRDDPVMQEKNYRCALAVFESAHKMGCSLFVGAGSQAEYGITNGSVDEKYPCNPVTEYGKFKWRASADLAKLAEEYRMRFIWMRIFSLYGRYDYSGTLIMSAIEKMKQNEPIKMTACTQNWDYLYIEDAVVPMVRFAEMKCESGIYHIANGDHKPLREYVTQIYEVIGSSSDMEFGVVPYGSKEPVTLEPNVSKTQKALNWKAETPFCKGILKLLDS